MWNPLGQDASLITHSSSRLSLSLEVLRWYFHLKALGTVRPLY